MVFAGAYQTFAAAAFVIAVPDNLRGQAYLASPTRNRVAQGLGVVIAGAVRRASEPSLVVAIFASLGTILAVVAGICLGDRATWRPTQPPGERMTDVDRGERQPNHGHRNHAASLVRATMDGPPRCPWCL